MAHIQTRETTAGTKSYRVVWRHGGGRSGDRQSVTVDHVADAKRLARWVEEHNEMVRRDDPRILDRSAVRGLPPQAEVVGGPTFRQVADEFLATSLRHRHRTATRYRQTVRDHLAPWHDRPIGSIKKVDVQRLVKELAVDPQNVFDISKAIFNYALDQDPPLCAVNPCKGVRLPQVSRRRHVFLERQEVAWLIEAAHQLQHKRYDPNWGLLVETAFNTGLRMSEIAGLRVCDLALDRQPQPVVLVERAVRPTQDSNRGFTATKSASSRRSVPILTDFAEKLRPLTAQPFDNLIFPSWDGRPLAGTTMHGRWVATVRRAQEPAPDGTPRLRHSPRFHDIRHTYARLALLDGVPLASMQEWLGHDSITTTKRYYGTFGDRAHSQVERFRPPDLT